MYRRLTAIGGVAALVLALLIASLGVSAASAASIKTERISGADRYTTSVAVSKAAYPKAGSARTIVLVSGETYADGVSAGPASAALGGPLLLTARAALPAATAAEITRLAPDRVIIAGGTSVVSKAVATAVRKLGPAVTRVAGSDRYDTSEQLARLAFLPAETSAGDGATPAPTPTDSTSAAAHVYIATGQAFPDSLAGSGLAAVNGSPLIVVKGTSASLRPELRQLLRDLGATKATMIGGKGAVSSGISGELHKAGLTVDRLEGSDRYRTAVAVAKAYPKGATSALLASGVDFPDALSAITLAAVRRAPILLTRPLCADAVLTNYVNARTPTRLTTIGGPGAVRGLVGSLTPCQSTTSPSSTWVLVNKKNALRPTTYAPGSLRRVAGSAYSMRSDATSALEKMFAAARKAGAGSMGVASAYRPYASQKRIFANYVATRGRAWAEKQSAHAGYSEHQTGLAADVVACGNGCGSIYRFSGTKQQKWVAANAWRYGFVVRYAPGQTKITGYDSEPWHLRYVGTALAADYASGGFRTLEQYLGYPAAPTY